MPKANVVTGFRITLCRLDVSMICYKAKKEQVIMNVGLKMLKT